MPNIVETKKKLTKTINHCKHALISISKTAKSKQKIWDSELTFWHSKGLNQNLGDWNHTLTKHQQLAIIFSRFQIKQKCKLSILKQ